MYVFLRCTQRCSDGFRWHRTGNAHFLASEFAGAISLSPTVQAATVDQTKNLLIMGLPDDLKCHGAPLASLTMASRMTRPTGSSTTAAAGRSVPVPAVPTRPGGSIQAAQHHRAAIHSNNLAAASSSTGHADQQQLGQQQRQHRSGFNPWRLPLAAGLVTFRLGRSVAAHVLPALSPARRHRQQATAGDMRVFPSLLPKRVSGGSSGPAGMPGGRKPALVWFRNDLRLHDHEALAAASSTATSILPVYVFDPREYGKSPNGFDKTGPYRAKFILEALVDLRSRLREAASDLVVRIGKPEEVLPQLARAVGAAAVYCHGEVTVEDAKVEMAVSKALDKAGAALKVSWAGTLFHVDDLPFKLSNMPSNYSDFKRALKGRTVREPAEVPEQIKGLPAAGVNSGEFPTLQQLGFDSATLQRCANDKSASGAHLRGGESEALRRLNDFIAKFHPQPQAATTCSSSGNTGGSSSADSNHGAAPNFCCKISPWLALGCLSPRQLYVQLQQQAGRHQQQLLQEASKQDDTDMQCLLFELLWRDFFRFITKKYTVTGVAQRLGSGPVLSETPATAALAMA